jgi:hypothetical protein
MNAATSLFGWDEPMQPRAKAKTGQAKGSAAPIGSGPKDETCKSCRHAYARRFAKTYWKCDLVKETGGPGSDIRLKWKACARWKAKQETITK